jgi:hypothetical protein
VNVAASVIALVARRFAAIPADANHTYGHDKAEFFAAVIEGVLTSLPRCRSSATPGRLGRTCIHSPCRRRIWRRECGRHGAERLWAGLRADLAPEARRSPALTADGWHLIADVVHPVGIAIGVGLVVLTGYLLLDRSRRPLPAMCCGPAWR